VENAVFNVTARGNIMTCALSG